MREDHDFKVSLQGKKIPILVLDQKWHRLFAIHGKPERVQELEKELTELLSKQGKYNKDLKDLKKVKNNLLDSVMEHMEGAEDNLDVEARNKKQEENKRLIDQVNERMEDCEENLLEIPKQISQTNEELMLCTMDYCYENFRVNKDEAQEIADWIDQVRIDLKKNIIRKQNREINNKEMYSYLHDIFGPEVLDTFDIEDEKLYASKMSEEAK